MKDTAVYRCEFKQRAYRLEVLLFGLLLHVQAKN